MISPSLAVMLFQSILRNLRPEMLRKRGDYLQEGRGDFTADPHQVSLEWDMRGLRPIEFALRDWTAKRFPGEWSRLPVLGRIAPDIELGEIQEHITIDRGGDFLYFWGRIPTDVLANNFASLADQPAERYYLDLGTPLRTEGSGSQYDAACHQLLQRTPQNPSSAKCGVAIIDLGESSLHGPDDYGGRLRHAVTSGIKLSDHAEKVLSILLGRAYALLPVTTVSCALIRPPVSTPTVGNGCFDQASSVELCAAVLALERELDKDNLPAAINISLGTHVGPHNGDSPLEEYIAAKLCRPHERFVVVAAGNDGGSGLAAKRELSAGAKDYLKVQTGSRCQDLLVEFWWYEPVVSTFELQVDVFGPLAGGGRAHLGATRIRSGKSLNLLSAARMGLPSRYIAQALFHSKCRNDLSSIAFSISDSSGSMPVLEIEFSMESTVDVTVNAWIVICEPQPQTTFIQGGAAGTVRVPASDPHVVSVAGNDSTGQIWVNSSRGPAAEYGSGSNESAPLMSHLAWLGTEVGTSFSSPRACGDMLQTIANSSKLSKCQDAIDLVCETYGLTRTGLPWDRRSGYHKMKA